MNRPMKTVQNNDKRFLNELVHSNHYLFNNQRMNLIQIGNQNSQFECLNISMEHEKVEDHILLTRLEFKNISDQPFTAKLFVENFIDQEVMNYAFISPNRDFLFLANEDGLYLTSGLFDKSSINQYSIVKARLLENYTTEFIPFRPIGNGNVASVYSLEKRIQPNEVSVAYTWVLFTESSSEKELIRWNNHLKRRLAFLEK